MRRYISQFRAISVGLLVVNGPVLLLLFGPIWVFLVAIESGVIDSVYSWVGFVVAIFGFFLAWLWWSISVPRWRIWAYANVEDIQALKQRAVDVGLTWPDGHVFGKTEIKTPEMRDREHELDR